MGYATIIRGEPEKIVQEWFERGKRDWEPADSGSR